MPSRRFPDIVVEIDGHKLLIQVKIDSISKLLDDVAETYPLAKEKGADLIGILFPSEVRQIPPSELPKVGFSVTISRALVLSEWLGKDFVEIRLKDLMEQVIKEYVRYVKTKTPYIDFMTVARIARDAVEELSIILRKRMGIEKYANTAIAIVGRFDIYRAMLESLQPGEKEIKAYMADIIAYLTVLQLLFVHTVSAKIYGKSILPQFKNPLVPPKNILDNLIESVLKSGITERYPKIIGPLPSVLEIFRQVASTDPRVIRALAKYLYAINAIKPEHVEEELFGRIYQECLPPQARKNLGSFFTHPNAAYLLAKLAIDETCKKVLDPACGSGTLLVKSYVVRREHGSDHKTLVENTYGLDIMRFAVALASTNIAFQDILHYVEPKIYAGDGVEKMINCNFTEPKGLERYIDISEWIKGVSAERLRLPCKGFDLVIMNPPFTRRERIPLDVRENVEKSLGDVVRGKVGYWAYFVAAADNVLRLGGKLAMVVPEEFFAGRSAESLRRYMFTPRDGYVYSPLYIVRSTIDVAFSEGAKYRDYLIVMEKAPHKRAHDQTIIILLNKKKDNLAPEDVNNLLEEVKKAEKTGKDIEMEFAHIFTVRGVRRFINEHINNLKPLVGFNCLKAQRTFLKLLKAIVDKPTLKEVAKFVIYNPGQYKAKRLKGVEDYARRLFIARYGARGKVTFRYMSEDEEFVKVNAYRKGLQFKIPKEYLKPSLRSPAQVKHMDITGEAEYAIINSKALNRNNWRSAGFNDAVLLEEAVKDVHEASKALAANILIVRRVQFTSPNIHWLTFYSQHPLLFTTSPFIGLKLKNQYYEKERLITLYLNSSIALLQLLGYFVESRGAWGTLHAELVWSNISVPDLDNLNQAIISEANKVFQKISKSNVVSIYERIKRSDPLQREIDDIALKLLGITDIDLNDIYEAIVCELDSLQRILEESGKESRKKTSIDEDKKLSQVSLIDYISN